MYQMFLKIFKWKTSRLFNQEKSDEYIQNTIWPFLNIFFLIGNWLGSRTAYTIEHNTTQAINNSHTYLIVLVKCNII